MENQQDVKVTLRYPKRIEDEYRKLAEKEGISKNSAIVQALAWALEFRGKFMNESNNKAV
ncbi:Arc family DNA-binding protein [uncultured Tolumonas sp.]|uniref:Arc family DNA-binding protein n=1 Tax=uncultured Tolumonas sp. TaxID=263765 RepID=UPI002A0A7F31|nr:Arc family DNA-binding protein [uncultured Tolumonas sp.]